jgi:hypothetical protein
LRTTTSVVIAVIWQKHMVEKSNVDPQLPRPTTLRALKARSQVSPGEGAKRRKPGVSFHKGLERWGRDINQRHTAGRIQCQPHCEGTAQQGYSAEEAQPSVDLPPVVASRLLPRVASLLRKEGLWKRGRLCDRLSCAAAGANGRLTVDGTAANAAVHGAVV